MREVSVLSFESRECVIYLVMYWKSMRYAREAVMTLRSPQMALIGFMKANGDAFPT
jgi:hypothetical protein